MLGKENIYINLQGKSKEELTELYELVKDNLYTDFRLNSNNEVLDFQEGVWIGSSLEWVKSKQEVTIEQLKEILQPMENKEEQLIKEAKERGFLKEGNEFYSCFDDKNELRIIKPYDSKSEINLYLDKNGSLRYYDGLNDEYDESLCSNPAIYKDGVWAEIKNNNLTLQKQLEKAKAEVERLQKAIEDSKIKVGDWVFFKESDVIFKVKGVDLKFMDSRNKKITDQELINKLNELIK